MVERARVAVTTITYLPVCDGAAVLRPHVQAQGDARGVHLHQGSRLGAARSCGRKARVQETGLKYVKG